MAHYFTREEAEALLPAIIPVLEQIRDQRKAMVQAEIELGELQMLSKNNGHDLHERVASVQQTLEQLIESLQELAAKLETFGCILKDPDMGLIDFLGRRGDRDIYLCFRLGEKRILYWHYLDAGFAGRQPF
jgi:hypothetical protein